MSRKMNYGKVSMQKRVASEYRLYGDPLKKPMFSDGTTSEIGKKSNQRNTRKAKRSKKR
jgi:hypothetical protein